MRQQGFNMTATISRLIESGKQSQRRVEFLCATRFRCSDHVGLFCGRPCAGDNRRVVVEFRESFVRSTHVSQKHASPPTSP
jgi:hypothetical protein